MLIFPKINVLLASFPGYSKIEKFGNKGGNVPTDNVVLSSFIQTGREMGNRLIMSNTGT